MSVEAMVQAMIDDLTAALGDAAKHDKGNSAAGTRVRKAMQACKAAAATEHHPASGGLAGRWL